MDTFHLVNFFIFDTIPRNVIKRLSLEGSYIYIYSLMISISKAVLHSDIQQEQNVVQLKEIMRG